MRGRMAVGTGAPRALWLGLALALVASVVGCGGVPTHMADLEGVGTAWTRVPHDDAVFGAEGEGYVHLTAVTAGGPGYIAVGSVATEDPADPTVAAVWTSTDGRAWARVPHDDVVFGSDGWTAMSAVTVGGPGLVAVGTAAQPPGSAVGAVWVSTDGVVWTRVTDSDEAFGGSDDVYLQGVTAGGPGLVAVGMIREAYHESSWEDEGLGGDGPEEQGWDDEDVWGDEEGREDQPPPPPDEEEERLGGPGSDEEPPPGEEGPYEEPLEDEREGLDGETLLEEEEDPD